MGCGRIVIAPVLRKRRGPFPGHGNSSPFQRGCRWLPGSRPWFQKWSNGVDPSPETANNGSCDPCPGTAIGRPAPAPGLKGGQTAWTILRKRQLQYATMGVQRSARHPPLALTVGKWWPRNFKTNRKRSGQTVSNYVLKFAPGRVRGRCSFRVARGRNCWKPERASPGHPEPVRATPGAARHRRGPKV